MQTLRALYESKFDGIRDLAVYNWIQRARLRRKAERGTIPGPAGLVGAVDDPLEGGHRDFENVAAPRLYDTGARFETWREMKLELGGAARLLEKYNVRWILDKSQSTHKVPFLAAKIKDVRGNVLLLDDVGGMLSCVYLSSYFVLGEIDAVVDDDVYDQVGEHMVVNAVVVLTSFTILNINAKRRYVLVTAKTLAKVYAPAKVGLGMFVVTRLGFSVLDLDAIDAEQMEPSAKRPKPSTSFNFRTDMQEVEDMLRDLDEQHFFD